MANSKTKLPAQPKGIMAARDPSFTRIAADVSMTHVVQQDVDVALMVRQAAYKDIIMGDDDQPREVVGGMTLLEVARLRMPGHSAMLLAFNLLRSCAEADFFEIENFEEAISDIREMIVKADEAAHADNLEDIGK